MGKKLLAAFDAAISTYITKTPALADLTRAVLEAADDTNAERAASSSGKYHPVSDQGIGGNVRHSILVLKAADCFMRGFSAFDEDDVGREAVLAAAILHDICKYENKDAKHTSLDHPLKAADLILDVAAKKKIDLSLAEVVAGIVRSHMGRWNKGSFDKSVMMPVPDTLQQRVLHFSDLIAANKDFAATVVEFTKEVESVDGNKVS